MSDLNATDVDLGDRLRDEAITASLAAEAHLHDEVVMTCKTCFEGFPQLARLLADNERAAGSTETLEYWRKQSERSGYASEIIKLLQPSIRAGSQPIFAAVSFCTQSAGPTVFLPVPYDSARKNVNQFRESLWINAEHCLHADLAALDSFIEAAARSISHALMNISYSARIDDTPVMSWLAKSHKDRSALYIPDVTNLRQANSFHVVSVSTGEEPFLGMASVLYLPLYNGAETKVPATAVLVLWSPIPRRWAGTLDELGLKSASSERRSTEPSAYSVKDYSSLNDYLWSHLRWLANVVSRDESDVRRTELELLSFMLAMESWGAQQGGQFEQHFRDFFHGSYFLLECLKHAPKGILSARSWIRDQLEEGGGGFVNELGWQPGWKDRVLTGTNVILKRWTDSGLIVAETHVGDSTKALNAFLSNIPANVGIPFDHDVAMRIASEPAKNIGKYAAEVRQIQILLTQKFITLRYVETPKPSHIQRLVGSPEAFRRYYSTRRGLAPPPHPDRSSPGLGLWLYRVFEAKMSIFWKLYVSPDGAEWHTDVAVRALELGKNENG